MGYLKHFTEDKSFRHVYLPVKEMKAVPYLHSICVGKLFLAYVSNARACN